MNIYIKTIKIHMNLETQTQMAVISFYSFTNIENIEQLQQDTLLTGKKLGVKGTILLAPEGFNGSLSGSNDDVEMVLQDIISRTAAKDVNVKVNYCHIHPFEKLKVRLKKEIVTMGLEDLDVNSMKGEYIDPADWDAFIESEDTIMVDTRNDYEVEIGNFKGALNPMTTTFRQLPNWVEENKEILQGKKIAMYCTGGIRCEKSTAYVRSLGFEQVYHLKGGILQYLEDTGNKQGKWQGECYVFDNRGAVNTDLNAADGYWEEKVLKTKKA